VYVRLQDRLVVLKHATPQRIRYYKAHLWEDSDQVQESMLFVGNLASDSTIVEATDSDADRIYEDPGYLEQYVFYWDDSDGNALPVEHQAYVSSENAAYLRKVGCLASVYASAIISFTVMSVRFSDILVLKIIIVLVFI